MALRINKNLSNLIIACYYKVEKYYVISEALGKYCRQGLKFSKMFLFLIIIIELWDL